MEWKIDFFLSLSDYNWTLLAELLPELLCITMHNVHCLHFFNTGKKNIISSYKTLTSFTSDLCVITFRSIIQTDGEMIILFKELLKTFSFFFFFFFSVEGAQKLLSKCH